MPPLPQLPQVPQMRQVPHSSPVIFGDAHNDQSVADPATANPASATIGANTDVTTLSARALDELADRLYEPLTARLKTELWLDRERSGLLVNLRR